MELKQRLIHELSQLRPGTPEYRTLELRFQALCAGITPEEFAIRKSQARAAWEAGGGFEGARERLQWADDFLARHRTVTA